MARTDIRVFHQSWPAFKSCGGVGLILALSLVLSLTAQRGGSLVVMLLLGLLACLTFLALAMASKIIHGKENLTFYHHLIAILITTTAALWLLHRPLLFYLDILILGVGLFHVCGRLGCLLVGCCHGRPSRWGIRYRKEHAAEGFPFYLVDVRLFPVQAVESLWVLGLVFVGSLLVLGKQQPGTALVWYLIGYGSGRFCFEFQRGDAERSFLLGFSEAQWTSLLLICGGALLGLTGVLPISRWQTGIIILWLPVVAVQAVRRLLDRTAQYKLLHPRHLKEIAQTLERISDTGERRESLAKPDDGQRPVQVGCTSLGLRISAGQLKSAEGNTYHYALSAGSSAISEVSARTLAELILRLRHPHGSSRMIQGQQGVYHVLVRPSGSL